MGNVVTTAINLAPLERRLDKATKGAKSGGKKAKREVEMCQALLDHLMEYAQLL